MDWQRLLILIAAFVMYLVIGGLVFSALETTNEETTRVDLRKYKERILENLTCLSEDQLEELIMKIVTAVDNGLSPFSNVTSSTNWDFSSSFFFSGTVVTTIGYGNISPSTSGGRAFCIFYAIIGIPIFGIVMAAISEKLKDRANVLQQRLNKRFLQHPKAKSAVNALLLLSICVLFFMIIPSIIFSHIEMWTFAEAFYFSFITLTTIGFGDYVIGTNPDIDYHVLYKWGTYCWIIIGLALLALVIAFISDLFLDTAEKIQQKQEEMKNKRKQMVQASAEDTEENAEISGNSSEMKGMAETKEPLA